jgi:DNA-binding response OmpR family regulator
MENRRPTVPAIGDRVTRTIPLLLIVDDDAAVAGILTSELTEAGFEAVRAADGQEGLELFKRCRPDLVLTDDVMPRLSGFELIEAIRLSRPPSS